MYIQCTRCSVVPDNWKQTINLRRVIKFELYYSLRILLSNIIHIFTPLKLLYINYYYIVSCMSETTFFSNRNSPFHFDHQLFVYNNEWVNMNGW